MPKLAFIDTINPYAIIRDALDRKGNYCGPTLNSLPIPLGMGILSVSQDLLRRTYSIHLSQ